MTTASANSDSLALPKSGQSRLVRWPRSRRRQILFVGIYLLFLVTLVWGGSRLFWKWKFGVPLTSNAEVWDYYFPELRKSGVIDAVIKPNDGVLDVVILGASTLESGWGNVEELLLAALQREFGEHVRIFNLATIAHTSRDSVLKFSRIADKPFDLVIIYDGFNDCRMNNCPPESFRDDYSHCARYHSFLIRKAAGTIMLPLETLRADKTLLGPGDPGAKEMAHFGGNLKTPGPFRQNLTSILDAAKQQGSLVVLSTFASHIPADYTDEKLKAGQLDFGTRSGSARCPLEMWGRKPDVIACVQAHNAAIQELARKNADDVIFVDQAALLGSDGQNFIDACHFSDQGCQRFVDNLMAQIKPRMREKPDF